MKEEDFIIFEIDDDDNGDVEADEKIALKKIRWITGLEHTFEITGETFKSHIQLKDWCLEQCSGKVIFFEKVFWNEVYINMYFYNKEDAVKCKLTWG